MYQQNAIYNYLAQKIVFGQVLFLSACMCVCVCVRVYIDYLKKFLTDFDGIWQDVLLW